jgi:hypothetical protein
MWLLGGLAAVACLVGMAGSASAGIIASDGFNPVRDGFSFPNYGGGYANLSADQMRLLFGDGVCAYVTKSNACALTPTAQTYMDSANMLMSSAGHCFGFSVLSMLIWRHEYPPLARQPIGRLRLRGNTALQRALAYTFQWQMLPVVHDAEVHGTPNQVLHVLIGALRHRGGELYTMGIFRPGLVGGHAITPYAVASRGHGLYDVLVYDNNWPDQVRRVHFNTLADTWSYVAAVNPSMPGSLYRGDAQTGTIELIPTTPGLGVHVCPFCSTANGNPYPFTQSWLQGDPYNHGHLLIRDDQGHEIGYDHGVFTRRFPRATAVFPTSFTDLNQAPLPVYQIPFGISLHVTIDGFGLKYPDTERFTYIGQKRDVTIDRIQVRPNEKESITLNYQQDSMTYVSAGSQITGPVMSYGLIQSAGDYSVTARALTLHPDSVIKFQDNQSASTLAINDSSASGQTFEVQVSQPAPNGTVTRLIDVAVVQPPREFIDVLYGQLQNGRPTIQIVP